MGVEFPILSSVEFLGACPPLERERRALASVKSVSPLSTKGRKGWFASMRGQGGGASRRPGAEGLPIININTLHITADAMEYLLGSVALLFRHEFMLV